MFHVEKQKDNCQDNSKDRQFYLRVLNKQGLISSHQLEDTVILCLGNYKLIVNIFIII